MMDEQSITIPKNEDAEAAVLGTLLLEPDSWDEIKPAEEWFCTGKHYSLFCAMDAVRRRGGDPDISNVAPVLKQNGVETPAAWLADLQAQTLPFKAETAVRVLRLTAMRRKALKQASALMEQCGNPLATETELRQAVEDIATSLDAQSETGIEYIGDAIARRALKLRDGIGHEGIRTGLIDLDSMIGGLRDGELIIIGGRPGMGKTAFALDLLRRTATVERPGLLFSLETSMSGIADRMIAADTGFEIWQIRAGQAFGKKIAERIRADLYALPVFLCDRRGLTVADIAAAARKLKRREGGIGPVVVDYMTLLADQQARGESRATLVERIANQLQALAGQLHTPVIVLSQLNRGVEARDKKRPQLADLRDSGGIEQAAHVVMLLYRDGYYDPHAENTLEVIVAKNKDGETGRVVLSFDAKTMRVGNLERRLT